MDVQAGEHLLAANVADDYVRAVAELLSAPERAAAIGRAGRDRVLQAYGWGARLSGLDGFLGFDARGAST